MTRVSVLGGGNTAFSLAVNLALGGHEVMIWEHPDFTHTLDPVRENLAIEMKCAALSSLAKLSGVTTDNGEASSWPDM